MNVPPLWTEQIRSILVTYPDTRPFFRDVYAADQLPAPDQLRRLLPWNLLVNTDPIRKPGQHWLLFGADNPYTLNVFDNYGLDLLQAYDNPWFRNLARAFRTLHQNPYPYQSVTTNVCAHYCIYVAVQRALSGHYNFGDLPERTPHCFRRNVTVVAHRVTTDLDFPDILPDTRADASVAHIVTDSSA